MGRLFRGSTVSSLDSAWSSCWGCFTGSYSSRYHSLAKKFFSQECLTSPKFFLWIHFRIEMLVNSSKSLKRNTSFIFPSLSQELLTGLFLQMQHHLHLPFQQPKNSAPSSQFVRAILIKRKQMTILSPEFTLKVPNSGQVKAI